MRGFDASSMIYAWDNYPPEQFPPLWRWMATQIESGEYIMSDVAYGEVERNLPEYTAWLLGNEVRRVPISSDMAQEALRIKSLLNIDEENYHKKGVNENDIFIIATASIDGHELISDEGQQNQLPDLLRKYKIPAVCALKSVNVTCMSFLDLIRDSGEVFGA